MHFSTDPEVAALAYPVPSGNSRPVRDAFVMGSTPGVVRAVFDGRRGDVKVRDASDLAKVADVAAAQGVQVSAVHTADGSESLTLAKVPERPKIHDPTAWPDDPKALRCRPDDLHLEITGSDGATGHRALTVGAVNVGSKPCVIQGYPKIAFHTLDEAEIDVSVTHDGSFMADDPGPSRHVVPVGARAVAVVGWDAMPAAELTSEVVLAVGDDAPMSELPLTSFVAPRDAPTALVEQWPLVTTLDIVEGTDVSVTAWSPASAVR